MSATPAVTESAADAGASGRDLTRLSRLAAVLAGVAVALAIGVLLFAASGDERFVVGADLPSIGFVSSAILFPVVGALIAQRRPLTRVAWLMIGIGLSIGAGQVGFGYGATGIGAERPFAEEVLVLAEVLPVPLPAILLAWLLLVFPSDRLLGPRWGLVGLAATVGGVIYGAATIITPGPVDIEAFPAIANPFGAPPQWAAAIDLVATAGNTLVVGSIGLAAASVALRYRRANAVEAAQIRWIALVGAIAALLFPVAALQLGPVSDLAFGLGMVALACLPIAIGFAITRYRLYEIDRLINRTLVYGALTAILAGVFTAAIGFAQRVFVLTTGETSDAAIVITTLVVATLYAPLRKRLEAIVDRYFKYEERRFGAYRDQLERVLDVIDPVRAAARLASETVRELEARGAAVVDRDDQVTASDGEWPQPASIRLPVPGGSGGLHTILVGPRRDGRPHDPRSVERLQEVAGRRHVRFGWARRMPRTWAEGRAGSGRLRACPGHP